MKKIMALMLCIILITFSGCNYTDFLPSDFFTQTGDSYNTDSSTDSSQDIELIPTPTQSEVYDYCYNQLDDGQKRMYNLILNAVRNMQTERVFLTKDGTGVSENVNLAYTAVSVDHPEIFWLSGEYQILTLNNEEFYVLIKYEIDETTRDGQVEALHSKVDTILAQTEDMTSFEKERFFHDYLCDNVVYTGDGVDTRYTAFGALVNGKAVCEGYSRAMQLLCKSAGINCSLIKGIADEQSHMWNVVEISGEWYELDVTWDDLDDGKVRYKYFNLTSSEMRGDHIRFAEIKGIGSGVSLKGSKYNLNPPECTATEYNAKKIKNQ